MPRSTRSMFGILLGAAAVGVGVALLTRSRRGLGTVASGRVITEAHPSTPVVEEFTTDDGMKVQHRRSQIMTIEERVANIQDMVWKSILDPEMRKLALAITNHCPERDDQCEMKAIYKAIKNRVRYTGDVAPVKVGGSKGPVEPIDLYQTARRTWEFKGGDCDDHNTLAATLLSLNGIPARLRVTAESPTADWGHIYVVAGTPRNTPRKWVALDTTLPGKNKFAYEVPFGRNVDFVSHHAKGKDGGVKGARQRTLDYPV